ncbi:GNAT family N-acetyltransferase [Actinospica robiniae]|uniref:GNAT family N-acetyltransferase n=1 Tax=Actinospica robiniae TaxID=304901 RepID=UPI00146F9740|nr:N-acetyltransferase [Actinospica robiniae]
MSLPTRAPGTGPAEAAPGQAGSSDRKVELRWVEREDLEAIADLDHKTFPDMPYPLFVLRQHLDAKPQSIFLVIEEDGVVGGYALALVISSRRKAWLLGIAVAEEYRGRHYGDRLLSSVLEQCRNQGVRQVLITVRPNNDAALGLYKKYHFRKTSREENYYGDLQPREILRSKLYEAPSPFSYSA